MRKCLDQLYFGACACPLSCAACDDITLQAVALHQLHVGTHKGAESQLGPEQFRQSIWREMEEVVVVAG